LSAAPGAPYENVTSRAPGSASVRAAALRRAVIRGRIVHGDEPRELVVVADRAVAWTRFAVCIATRFEAGSYS